MFGYYTKKLKDFMNSNLYLDSTLHVVTVDGQFAIKEKDRDEYVDLKSPQYSRSLIERWGRDSIGSPRMVLNALKFRLPVIGTVDNYKIK